MIISPVQINTDEGKTINGVILEQDDLNYVIDLIDRSNADGLKGDDAVLVLKLKDASRELAISLQK